MKFNPSSTPVTPRPPLLNLFLVGGQKGWGVTSKYTAHRYVLHPLGAHPLQRTKILCGLFKDGYKEWFNGKAVELLYIG